MARPRLGHRSVNASVINAGGYGVRSPIDSTVFDPPLRRLRICGPCRYLPVITHKSVG